MAFDHFRRVRRDQTNGCSCGVATFAQGAGKLNASLISLSPSKTLLTVNDRLAVRQMLAVRFRKLNGDNGT